VSEHHFLTGPGHLPSRADKIARKHGATLTNHREPRGEQRHWFSCANRGYPFDRETERAVRADLEAAGLIQPQQA